jgi:hypothetical protein
MKLNDNENVNNSNVESIPNSEVINTTNEPTAAIDSREDSILHRPRTETYETKKNDETFDIIKKHNPTHAEEEKKRDDLNRINNSGKIKKRIKLF